MLWGLSGFPHLPENEYLVCADATATVTRNNAHAHRILVLIFFSWEIRVRRVQTQFGIFRSRKIPKREFPILILVRQPYTRKFAVMQ
jgi:hypothetical protein